MEVENGSQWDFMMDIIIERGRFLNQNAYTFRSECSTIDFLNRATVLRLVNVFFLCFLMNNFLMTFFNQFHLYNSHS